MQNLILKISGTIYASPGMKLKNEIPFFPVLQPNYIHLSLINYAGN